MRKRTPLFLNSPEREPAAGDNGKSQRARNVPVTGKSIAQETNHLKGHIVIDSELCKECHLCIHACKKGLIVPSHEYNSRGYRPVRFKEGEECTGCALCATTCPDIAIEVYRE